MDALGRGGFGLQQETWQNAECQPMLTVMPALSLAGAGTEQWWGGRALTGSLVLGPSLS